MPKTDRSSTNAVLSQGGFHHIALRARNYDLSYAFYTEGLGFTVGTEWGEGETRVSLLDIGDGNYLELFASAPGQAPAEGETVPPHWPFWHLAFRSSDVDADIERVRALGCTVTIEPKDVVLGGNPVRVGFFLGPDGEVLEFFHHKNEPGAPQL